MEDSPEGDVEIALKEFDQLIEITCENAMNEEIAEIFVPAIMQLDSDLGSDDLGFLNAGFEVNPFCRDSLVESLENVKKAVAVFDHNDCVGVFIAPRALLTAASCI